MNGQMRTKAIPDETVWTATLITRGDIVISVRPALPTDEAILADLFERVSPSDLRFRFLSAMRHVGRDRLHAMINIDYDRTMTFIAFDSTGEAIATAMLATDVSRKDAEVAISVRSDMKNKGVGWTLLQHVLRYGEARGLRTIRSIESRQNNETISLERDAGFAFEACEGNPADVVAIKHLAGHPS